MSLSEWTAISYARDCGGKTHMWGEGEAGVLRAYQEAGLQLLREEPRISRREGRERRGKDAVPERCLRADLKRKSRKSCFEEGLDSARLPQRELALPASDDEVRPRSPGGAAVCRHRFTTTRHAPQHALGPLLTASSPAEIQGIAAAAAAAAVVPPAAALEHASGGR